MSWNKQRRLEEAAHRVDFDAMQREMLTPEVTGQVIFREAGRHGSGRRLMMFVGVVAMEDDTPVKGEHQYVMAGNTEHGGVSVRLHVVVGDTAVIDRTEEARGMGLGSLVTQPWWRV